MAKNTVVYFDSYDTGGYEELAKEYLSEDGSYEPSDDEIWYAVNTYLEEDWNEVSNLMDRSFNGQPIIISGSIERWTGKSTGGDIYKTWQEFISKFGKDCEYFKIYTEKGHLFVECSHHDGNNFCEIKVMTPRGEKYLDNWEWGLDPRTDKKSECKIRTTIFNCSRYSQLPKIAW